MHKLSGLDRINIPKILPKEAGLLEQQTAKEIIEITSIKSEEFKEFDLAEDRANERITWDVEKIKIEKDFDLKKTHVQVLKDAVDKLDKAKKITQQLVDTCTKIRSMR